MKDQTCLLCGLPLNRPAPWWAKLIGLNPPPTHKPDGLYGEVCWQAFNKRMGITNPGPKPDVH